MTGRALFNEVFLDEARVPHANVIGEVGEGWRVANTTLMVERSGIDGNNVAAPSAAIPGTIAGHLLRPAGSFEDEVPALGEGGDGSGRVKSLIRLAEERGTLSDRTIRDGFMRLHSMVEITTWHLGRMKSGNAVTGGEGNLAKLRNSDVIRLARDLGCRILGADATLVGPEATSGGSIQEMTMFSPSPSIYRGSDQVQRNIIGERVLGLPKKPGPDKATPFRGLPQNT